MKREFLQNFKVGDQALPKEIIDAVLDEHSRSIGAIKAEKESLASGGSERVNVLLRSQVPE